MNKIDEPMDYATSEINFFTSSKKVYVQFLRCLNLNFLIL
jgi:hypothetical protein